jgi:hypothetical protein
VLYERARNLLAPSGRASHVLGVLAGRAGRAANGRRARVSTQRLYENLAPRSLKKLVRFLPRFSVRRPAEILACPFKIFLPDFCRSLGGDTGTPARPVRSASAPSTPLQAVLDILARPTGRAEHAQLGVLSTPRALSSIPSTPGPSLPMRRIPPGEGLCQRPRPCKIARWAMKNSPNL